MEKTEKQYEVNEIRAIQMELDCAEFVVLESEDDAQIRIEAEVEEKDIYEEYVDNGVLKVRHKWKKQWFKPGDDKANISLWIPKGRQFEKISLEIGAGDANLSKVELVCDNMKLEVGAGNIDIASVKITDKLDVEIGAGSVNLRNATVTNVNVESGVGSCYLGLAGSESDYNYDISCGVGKIQINDNYMKQIGGSEKRRNPNAIGNIKLDCGVGRIEVHTAE